MSGVKNLTSFLKKLRTASIESARTLSTLSTTVMSIIDLTDLPSDDKRPALTALADCYEESGS